MSDTVRSQMISNLGSEIEDLKSEIISECAVLAQNLESPFNRQRLHSVAAAGGGGGAEERVVDRFLSRFDHRQKERRHGIVCEHLLFAWSNLVPCAGVNTNVRGGRKSDCVIAAAIRARGASS